jgi:chromosome segregation ATPase
MTETALMTTDLDRLAERVEKAALLVQKLRDDQEKLTRERDALAQQLEDLQRKLQGQDVAVLVQELGTLRREQKDWQADRREVASRIETMLKKLEKLEA